MSTTRRYVRKGPRAAYAEKKSTYARSGVYRKAPPKIAGRSYKTALNKMASHTYSNPGPVGQMGRFLGRTAGQAIGGPIGGMLGESAGGLAHYIGKIFGSGDYVASKAPRSNSILSSQTPSFVGGSGMVRIRHREFLGDVISASTANTFDVKSYSINPGLARSYPWLSSVCGSTFQQYQINGQCYEYRSMSSDALNSVNTALGQILMCTDYDSADAPFTSKQQMENTEFGVSCKPSVNMLHAIECATKRTSLSKQYIRAFDNPAGTDIRMYDLGKFYIATNGCQGTSVNLGELWVTYDITLIKTIEQVPAYLSPFSQYALTGAGATAPFGTAQSQLIPGSSPNSIDNTFTENKVFWPYDIQNQSVYHVQLAVQASSAVALTAPVIRTGNGMFMNNNTVWKTTSGTTNLYILSVDVMYKGGASPANLPYLEVTDYSWPATISQADLYILKISGLWPGVYNSQLESPHPEDEDTDEVPIYFEEGEQKKPLSIQIPMSKMKIGSR